TNNSTGVSGFAGGWNGFGGVRFMSLRAGYRKEDIDQIDIGAAAEAVGWAANNGVSVINMSFGGLEINEMPELESAITDALNNHGVITVAAAGNYLYDLPKYKSVFYPAGYNNVIAVGATTESDRRKTMNDNTNEIYWGSCYGPELDIVAPGIHIPTTDLTGYPGYDNLHNYYMGFNGTSSAAPQVAALCGLLRSLNPNLTFYQIYSCLTNTAVKVNAMGGQNFTIEYGYGLVNAYEALKYVLGHFGGKLTQDVNLSQGTFTIYSGTTIDLNNHSIVAAGGSIVVQPGAVINGVYIKTGSNYNAIYPTIEQALAAAITGQTIVMPQAIYTVQSDIGVASGVTLQISSGTTLNFNSGTQLTVYGQLLADGVTFTCPDGSWKGVKLISANDGSYIKNSQIYRFGPGFGGDGIYIEDCSPLIEYNTISGIYNGIKVYAAGPIIRNNTIQNCLSGNGITVENGSNPAIYNNNIRLNYYHGISVYETAGKPEIRENTLYGNGYPTHLYTGIRAFGADIVAWKNTISNSYYAVYSESYSDIDFGYNYGPFFIPNNIIESCSYGLVAYDHSNITAGQIYDNEYGAAHNKITTISYNALHASNVSTIEARHNYYGPNGFEPTVYSDNPLSVNWAPLWDGGNFSKTGFAKNAFIDDEENSIIQARRMINKGEFNDAKKILKALIDKGSIKALNPLLRLFFESKDNEIRAYLENEVDKASNTKRENSLKGALLRLYYSINEYKLALEVADELIEKGKSEAKIDKFLIYALGLRDNYTASLILKVIEKEMGESKVKQRNFIHYYCQKKQI
ncbi:MAG: S8 family serine peptidase, partial [Syntrophothermus sp.]